MRMRGGGRRLEPVRQLGGLGGGMLTPNTYPTDASDEERECVAPHLTLMTADAPSSPSSDPVDARLKTFGC